MLINTVVKNVINHTIPSILLNFQNLANSLACTSIPFNATYKRENFSILLHFYKQCWNRICNVLTTMIDARIHLGSGSKNGPIHNSITSKIKQETILASCVLPPTACWIKDLLNDADTGIHEKKAPNILLLPCW